MTDSKIISLTENSFSDIANIAGVQNPQNQTVTFLKIDLPDILRAHAETLMEFYERGRNSVLYTPNAVPQSPKGNFSSTSYVGVFDRNSYGVYNDQDKFLKSKNYWNASSVKHQAFETRDEALRFARTGVAQLNGVTENTIPSMQFAINWRQKI